MSAVRPQSVPPLRLPQQARSQATLDRLLAAVHGLLAERRFEDATVHELVRRAGSSVGVFYMRFRDKEALLHHFDQRFFDGARQLWEFLLDFSNWRGSSVAQILTVIVGRMVSKRRQNQGVLRTLRLYVRNRPDPQF